MPFRLLGSRSRGRVAALALTLAPAVLLAGAADASAAQRFVSPTGSGGAPCSSGNPCSLQTAVETVAADGDEVIIAPGTYIEGADTLISVHDGLDIHGAAGGPKPVIAGSSSSGGQVQISGLATTISDVRIELTTPTTLPALYLQGTSRAVRVEAVSTGSGCQLNANAIIRDSICIGGSDTFEAGLSAYVGGGPNNPSARNVTAVGTFGVYAGTSNPPPSTVVFDVRNVIAVGTPAGKDVNADNIAGASTTINLQNSNYNSIDPPNPNETVTPVGSGTNQTAVPLFVDASLGNYRQATGSPTIDAGATDSLTGSSDLDGASRPQGAAIDIGAYEATPPVNPPPADATPPETTIDKGPKKKSKSKNASFTFSSSEAGSTFSCKLDKGDDEQCTSPLKLKHLKKGKHTLSVVATDAAGNADATAATYTWKIKRKRKHHPH